MLTRYLLSLRSTLTEICLWVLLLGFVGGGLFLGGANGGDLGSLAFGTVGALAYLTVAVLFISPFLLLGEILNTLKRLEAK